MIPKLWRAFLDWCDRTTTYYDNETEDQWINRQW
jgi:hypothetical protein